jgi:hypothetical protein
MGAEGGLVEKGYGMGAINVVGGAQQQAIHDKIMGPPANANHKKGGGAGGAAGGAGGGFPEVGLCKLKSQLTHSLKPPGLNPCLHLYSDILVSSLCFHILTCTATPRVPAAEEEERVAEAVPVLSRFRGCRVFSRAPLPGVRPRTPTGRARSSATASSLAATSWWGAVHVDSP